MLDAAEELLRLGGAGAVTVEAVIERAGTSTGSFYARFGSREGLSVAMHERFLEVFATLMTDVVERARMRPTAEQALGTFIDGLFSGVREHRNTAAFHMLHNAHNTEMREQGNEVTRALTAILGDLIAGHPNDPRRVDTARIDMAARVLFGLSLEMVLFDDDEVTGRAITPRQFTNRVTAMVVSHLW